MNILKALDIILTLTLCIIPFVLLWLLPNLKLWQKVILTPVLWLVLFLISIILVALLFDVESFPIIILYGIFIVIDTIAFIGFLKLRKKKL